MSYIAILLFVTAKSYIPSLGHDISLLYHNAGPSEA